MKNKTVETLVADTAEGFELPKLLKSAFESVPKECAAKEVKEIFKNVTGLYSSCRNILKGNDKQINEIVSSLAAYIEHRQPYLFKEAGALLREFSEKNLENEEIRKKAQEEAKLLAKQKALNEKAEQELTLSLKKLNERYEPLADIIESQDRQTYQVFVEKRNISEAKKILDKVEIRIALRNLRKENYEPLKLFLNSGEEFKFNEDVETYNSSFAEADRIIKKLENRKSSWIYDNESAFTGLVGEYSKLFPLEDLIQIRADFAAYVKECDFSHVERTLKKLECEIIAEKTRLDAEKRLKFEIQTLNDEIKRVNFSTLTGESASIRAKVEDLLSLPELKGDESLLNLENEVKIFINEVLQQDKTLHDVADIENSKAALQERLENITAKEVDLEKECKGLSTKLANTVQGSITQMRATFSGEQAEVNNAHQECLNITKLQREKAMTLSTMVSTQLFAEIKELDKKFDEVTSTIDIDAKQCMIKLATEVNSINEPKDLIKKIKEIDHEKAKADACYRQVTANGVALNGIETLYKESSAHYKAQCFMTLGIVIKALLKKTEQRMDAYSGRLITKTKEKKSQAAQIKDTLDKLLDAAKKENIVKTRQNINDLQNHKRKFYQTASTVSFWAQFPGGHCLSFTKNDQQYTCDMDAGFTQINDLVSQINRCSVKAS